MLNGVIKGNLKLTKKINRYLDLCLKCGKCSEFCPSGVNVSDVIAAAKYEYNKKHFTEKIKAYFKRYVIFGLIPGTVKYFRKLAVSKTFEKKVLYFGGCASKLRGDKSVVRLLNDAAIEVINPVFHCCGIPRFAMGDLPGFRKSLNSFISICKKYEIKEIVTACSSCEKTLKSYIRWADSEEDREFLSELVIKNIFEYLHEKNICPKLKTKKTVTYHKPCSLDNLKDIEWVLKNTKNLEYIEMKDFDKCCGLNGLENLKEYKIMSKLYSEKRENIINSGAKIVLSSCLGCDTALKVISGGRYQVEDLTEFLFKNME